jgi:hypothetical protein
MKVITWVEFLTRPTSDLNNNSNIFLYWSSSNKKGKDENLIDKIYVRQILKQFVHGAKNDNYRIYNILKLKIFHQRKRPEKEKEIMRTL